MTSWSDIWKSDMDPDWGDTCPWLSTHGFGMEPLNWRLWNLVKVKFSIGAHRSIEIWRIAEFPKHNKFQTTEGGWTINVREGYTYTAAMKSDDWVIFEACEGGRWNELLGVAAWVPVRPLSRVNRGNQVPVCNRWGWDGSFQNGDQSQWMCRAWFGVCRDVWGCKARTGMKREWYDPSGPFRTEDEILDHRDQDQSRWNAKYPS
ncbi:hypothetical protein BJ138DRAFT_1176794 [Hygrophoropsis aurantiaca]|uniref:Uncharacterized protein n=1 Tax=Hygrophoropsis aurantiaca TaxID=72124 RepID=A0ACB8AQC7_9AGAM|nr:hypothetical protein BJ138DRAFT_1176794 [Hygrophoropsis aurantiaca]